MHFCVIVLKLLMVNIVHDIVRALRGVFFATGFKYFPRRLLLVVILGLQVVLTFFLLFVVLFVVTVRGEFLLSQFDYSTVPALFDIVPALILDSSALVFMLVVVFVGLMVQIYSLDYMYFDRSLAYFFMLLFLFSISICLLVIVDSFVLFFWAWEVVGLCSFLLIGFWSDRVFSGLSAIKAISVNRIPDMLLFLGLVAASFHFNVSSFSSLLGVIVGGTSPLNGRSMWFVGGLSVLFILAACGKSAQFGFSGWLVSAMEGPTPVSALMHAATLVTAGAILLLKVSWVVSFSGGLIVGVGLVTAIYCGISACVESDLKAVTAYSTSSQLGFIFVLIGCGDHELAFLFMAVHAIFKSLLFWCVGLVVHAQNDQTLQFYGTKSAIPVVFIGLTAGLFSLLGIPFMSGFYSKEFLVDAVPFATVVTAALFVAQIVSVVYSLRIVRFWLSTVPSVSINYRRGGVWSLFSVLLLSFLAIAGGWFVLSDLCILYCGEFLFLSESSMYIAAVSNTRSTVGYFMVAVSLVASLICMHSVASGSSFIGTRRLRRLAVIFSGRTRETPIDVVFIFTGYIFGRCSWLSELGTGLRVLSSILNIPAMWLVVLLGYVVRVVGSVLRCGTSLIYIPVIPVFVVPAVVVAPVIWFIGILIVFLSQFLNELFVRGVWVLIYAVIAVYIVLRDTLLGTIVFIVWALRYPLGAILLAVVCCLWFMAVVLYCFLEYDIIFVQFKRLIFAVVVFPIIFGFIRLGYMDWFFEAVAVSQVVLYTLDAFDMQLAEYFWL